MLRQDLVTRAAEAGANDTAIDLARRITSAADIQAEALKLEQSQPREASAAMKWALLAIVLLVAELVAVLLVLLLAASGIRQGMVHTLAAGFVLALFSNRQAEAAKRRYHRQRRQLELLRPIAGTELCRDALHYIEAGYPDVLAWRDQALAEHEQLHAFDVELMRVLYEKVNQVRSREALEAACRKVHGISPA